MEGRWDTYPGDNFSALTEKLSVITYETRGLYECLHHWKKLQGYTSMSKMVSKTTPAFLPANREALGHYFKDCSFYYKLAQCNKRTPIPITLRLKWQVKSEKNKNGQASKLVTATINVHFCKSVSTNIMTKIRYNQHND